MKFSKFFVGVVQISILAVLMAITLILLIPVQNELEERMEELRQDVLVLVEEILGRSISYERIFPSIFSFIEVQNVSIFDETSGRRLVYVPRLRIYYDLIQLVSEGVLSSPSEIVLEGSRINLNMQEDRDFLQSIGIISSDEDGSIQKDTTEEGLSITEDLQFRLENTIVVIEDDRTQFNLVSRDTRAMLKNNEVVLEMDAQGAAQGKIIPDLDLNRLDFETQINGKISLKTGGITLTSNFERASSNLFQLSPQNFIFSLSNDQIIVQKVQDNEPWDARVLIDNGLLTASLISEDWFPFETIEFGDDLSDLSTIMDPVRLSSDLEFSLDLNSSSYSYAGYIDLLGQPKATGQQVLLRGSVLGDNKTLFLSDFTFESPMITGTYNGKVDLQNFFPEGNIRVSYSRGGKRILSNLLFNRDGSKGSLQSIETTIGEYRLNDFVVNYEVDGTSYNLSSELYLNSSSDEDSPVEDSAQVTVSARIDTLSGLITSEISLSELKLRVNALLFDELVSVFTATDQSILNDYFKQEEVDMDLSLNLSATLPSNNLPEINLTSFLIKETERNHPVLSFNANLSQKNYELDNFQLKYKNFSVSGEASGSILSADRSSIDGKFVIQEIPFNFTAIMDSRSGMQLNGDYETNLTIRPGVGIEYSLFELPLVPIGPDATISSRGKMDLSGNRGEISIDQFRLDRIPLFPLDSPLPMSVRLSAYGSLEKMEIQDIEYFDGISFMTGDGSFSLDETGSIKSQISMIEQDGESISLSLDMENQIPTIQFLLQNSPIVRWGIRDIRGNVAVNGNLSVENENINGEINLQTINTTLNNDPLEVIATFLLEDSRISLPQTSVQLVETTLTFPDAFWDLKSKAFLLDAKISESTNPGIELSFQGGYNPPNVEQSKSLFESDIASELISNLDGNLLLRIPDGKGSYNNQNMRIIGNSEGFILSDPVDDIISGFIRSEGDFTIYVNSPDNLGFEADGEIKLGKIEANFSNFFINLEPISALLDLGIFKMKKGIGTGAFRIVGDINDPDFYGTLKVTEVGAELLFIPETISTDLGFLVFEEKKMILLPIDAQAGQGSATVEAEFIISRWAPENFVLNVDTGLGPGVRFKNDFNAVVVDGTGQGTLRIESNPSGVWLTGDIRAESTEITISESLETVVEEGFVPLYLDLNLTTGRSVQFLWPNSSFPILRVFTTVGDELQLSVNTFSDSFYLGGEVGLRGGEIFWFEQSFFVRDGKLVFQENEELFNPLLTLSSELRKVYNTETVRLTLTVNETPISSMNPSISSDPPLSDSELNSLIGGFLPEENTEDPNILSEAILASTDVLSNLSVFRTLENNIRDTLDLDLFTLRSGFFGNLLEEAITTPTNPQENQQISIGKYLDNTTLFIGKYLGDDLFLSLMFQLSEQDLGITNPLGVVLDTELSFEWDTPFFLLQWNFTPSNIDELFVTDHKFSLVWDF